MGVIYIITSPSGKSYVGQTIRTVAVRWIAHVSEARRKGGNGGSRALNRAILKYGADKFKIEVLVICDDKDLDMYERKFIEAYRTKRPHGYNITDGGEGMRGWKPSEETRRKMHAARNSGLPMHIAVVRQDGEVTGYQITNHPTHPTRRFNSKALTLPEKLKMAQDYLAGPVPTKLASEVNVRNRDLPKYVCARKNGYKVIHPKLPEKSFTRQTCTREELLEKAKAYLATAPSSSA